MGQIKHRRILLIDDDDDDRQLFCEALVSAGAGAECYTVSEGNAAFVELDAGNIPMPDVIFIDINLPLMNGWQCLAKFKAGPQYQRVPVIMYTTSSFKRDREIARECGAAGLIVKPTDFKTLTAIVKIVAFVEDVQALPQALAAYMA